MQIGLIKSFSCQFLRQIFLTAKRQQKTEDHWRELFKYYVKRLQVHHLVSYIRVTITEKDTKLLKIIANKPEIL